MEQRGRNAPYIAIKSATYNANAEVRAWDEEILQKTSKTR